MWCLVKDDEDSEGPWVVGPFGDHAAAKDFALKAAAIWVAENCGGVEPEVGSFHDRDEWRDRHLVLEFNKFVVNQFYVSVVAGGVNRVWWYLRQMDVP